jgi:cytochrome c556
MKIYTILIALFLSVLLTACATTNSNLDELDRMELEDKQMINGQTFQNKQFMGDICKNPNY